MQSRLLAVAQNLEIPEEAPTPVASTGSHVAQEPARLPDAEAHTEAPVDSVSVTEDGDEPEDQPAPARVGTPARTDDAVDPRYEDMWGVGPSRPASSVDLPDLSSIDIDFDEEERS